MARACARVCQQLKGAPCVLLQGRVGVVGPVLPHSSREAERVCVKYVERVHEVSALCGECERKHEVSALCGECERNEEVLPEGGRNEEVLPAGGRYEEVLPAGGRNEVKDERRKALDEFLQRRILGVAHYWVWFATDFLAAIQKLPKSCRKTPVTRMRTYERGIRPWLLLMKRSHHGCGLSSNYKEIRGHVKLVVYGRRRN